MTDCACYVVDGVNLDNIRKVHDIVDSVNLDHIGKAHCVRKEKWISGFYDFFFIDYCI